MSWTVFPRIYTYLKSKVCFQFCFQVRRPVISTIVDPYMSFYEKWEIITETFHSWKFKISAFFYFWKNSRKQGQIIQLFALYSKAARNLTIVDSICQIFRSNKILPKYLTDRKLKMSALFIFEIKVSKKDKIFNFLKGGFSVMRSPVDMFFGEFSETYVRLLKSITLQFFSRHSKSHNNLNVKKCLKLNGP